jgi:hypothetical protein
VTGSLEYLLQDVLGNSRIQATDVESSLVRLGSCATDEATSRGRGGDTRNRHGRSDRGRDRVGVLGDDHRREGRGRHVAAGSRTVLSGRRSRWGLARRRRVLSIRHFGRSTIMSEIGKLLMRR